MRTNITTTEAERAAGRVSQQLMMKVLALVTEIMVDDVSLAEQLRTAVMTIWLAERRVFCAGTALTAWRDVQRGEQQLRRLLYQALLQGYLYEERFDGLMALLGQLRRQPVVVQPEPLREEHGSQWM